MAGRKWTNEQSSAIHAEGTLLVSAAAGSGKTAVLVERVIRKITEGPNPVAADRLLIVTYTNAAAAEMKERIANRINELIALNPDDPLLRRQQILLQNAHISTIHSFCLDMIRENFEKLDIPPDFRIADDSEMEILRQDVLDDILEKRYSEDINSSTMETIDQKPFIMLTEMLSSGRDDKALTETINRLYTFIRSLPDSESWLQEKLQMYHPDQSFADTVWGKRAFVFIQSALQNCSLKLRAALSEIHSNEQMNKAYSGAFENDLACIEKALSLSASDGWDKLRLYVSFEFQKLGALRKFEDDDLKERVKGARDEVKSTLTDLKKGLLSCSEAEFAEDVKSLLPVVRTLFDIVRELDSNLFREKMKKNILDFGDLEQLALRLLVEKRKGQLIPSATARRVSDRFDEILVDEYQDTNMTQDTIFRSISKNERNLFMVGDVKQSIYRFRQAMPEIFIEKKEKFQPYDPLKMTGITRSKIILGKNFRSRKGVTDSVNFIFNLLMTKEMGEIEYGSEDQLIPGADFPERRENDFAIHILDESEYDGEDDRDTLEARHISHTIQDMMKHDFQVSEGGKLRPVRYRDFCILMRSTSGRAEKYLRELTMNGIPVYAEIANGYLGSYEVAVMLSFLKILDNPLQDVPLLSVMMSPIFAFEPDDLAKIRTDERKKCLYLSLVEYAKKNGGKYSEFLNVLVKLRSLAAVLPADKLILKIYHMTGFLSVCAVMPGGSKRRANLRLLLDYARKYESAGYKGLSGFVRFIDRLGEKNGDLAPASVLSENSDVVRIMSIHKSKGLEFPVCFLAGCSRQFNREDLNKPSLFHPVYGFGSVVRDAELNCRYTTLPKEVVKIENEKSMLSEEMRVLYVAMTRAKDKLIAVMAFSNLQTALKKVKSLTGTKKNSEGIEKLIPFNAARANSYSEWLLASALSHPSCGLIRTLAGADSTQEIIPCESEWDILITKVTEFQKAESELAKNEKTAQNDGQKERIVKEIRERIQYNYDRRILSEIPSKVSVSTFSEQQVQDFKADEIRPMFLEKTQLTAAEKGTALHSFMQYARLDSILKEADAAKECERLAAEGFLLKEQSEAVLAQTEKIMMFLQSELYCRIKNANKVYKEFRFNLDTPVYELYQNMDSSLAGETVMLQGMADLIFEDDMGIYLLDYKTDRVGGGGEQELIKKYSGQLRYYSKAVSEILGQSVQEEYIYSFYLNKAIKI